MFSVLPRSYLILSSFHRYVWHFLDHINHKSSKLNNSRVRRAMSKGYRPLYTARSLLSNYLATARCFSAVHEILGCGPTRDLPCTAMLILSHVVWMCVHRSFHALRGRYTLRSGAGC
jgi:hypothetical protein